ncbi:MAG TPA: PxKF domain-containing protein [Pyrinomonadaceae bacterium]|nr:PxKF domain-containing protein [Pyrinomonadaceae bacterium]
MPLTQKTTSFSMTIALVLGVFGLAFPKPVTTTRSVSQSATIVHYTVTDLGTLGGSSNYSTAAGINDAGQVVGNSYDTSNHYTGFRYSGGTMTPVYGPSSGSPWTTLYGINASGTIGGRASFDKSYNTYSYYRAGYIGYCTFPTCYDYYGVTPATGQTTEGRPTIFAGTNIIGLTGMTYVSNSTYYGYSYITNDWGGHWTYNGTWTGSSITVSNSNSTGQVNAINNAGNVAGYEGTATSAGNYYHAFVYANGTQTDLGTLNGNVGTSYAYDINNSGVVVGEAETAGGTRHAFIYESGVMQDLGTLGGNYSYAYGINGSGHVAGAAYLSGNQYQHAFLYDSVHGMQDIGTIDGYSSFARDVNDSDTAVGNATTPSGNHAMVYNANTGMQDLNSLIPADSGWTLNDAIAINNGGQIVGNGTHNGGSHAFLLTPINSSTTTSISASQPSTTYGDSVTFTANVTSENGNPPDGETVEFFDGATSLGSSMLSNGSATLSLASLSAGPHSITASYSGDAALDTSSSQPLAFTVAKQIPVISWSTPANIVYGTALSGAQLNATASVPGEFLYTPAAGTVLHAGAAQTLHVDFTPTDNTNYASASDNAVTINVDKATASVSATGGTFIFDGTTHAGSGSATGGAGESLTVTLIYSGTGATTYGPTSTAPTNAGAYQAIAHTDGDADNIGADSAPAAIVINKASSTTSVSCDPGPHIYDGSALTPCSAQVNGDGGLSQSLAVQYSNNTDAGSASATASFGGDANHSGSSDSTTFAIAAADSTTVVTCPSTQIFSGSAIEPCSVTVSGPGGLHLTPAPAYANNLNVGAASASYDYAGDANHHGSNGAETFTINKATVTVTVTCPGHITYTGSALEPCTAAVTGPALNQSLPVTYSNNSNAGSASASASFAGDENHTGDSDSKTFAIDKASSAVTLTCASGPFTYTAAAQIPCHANVTGAGSLNQSLNVTYTDNINAGTAGAKAEFNGDSNHNSSNDSKNFVIDKAPLTVTADNKTMIFGSLTPPAFTATFSGFVGAQTAAGLGFVPAFTVKTMPLPGSIQTVNGSTPVGVYAIIPAGLSSGNYSFTYNYGLFTVTPWTILGFYQPVDMNTPSLFIWNAVKGGSTVPLKFNLYAGTPGPLTERKSAGDVLFGSVQIANISCSASAGLETLVDNVTDAGNTSLRYDGTEAQFVQNWKTPKSPNMCYQVRVTSLDGSHIDAYFKTK